MMSTIKEDLIRQTEMDRYSATTRLRANSIPEVIVSFMDSTDKILNPYQRQLFEDTQRVKEQIQQLDRQRGIGSPTNLYVRKVEEKVEPEEMDLRDSFYHTTKSLLVLFQIMGVMPIMRSPKGKNMLKLFIF